MWLPGGVVGWVAIVAVRVRVYQIAVCPPPPRRCCGSFPFSLSLISGYTTLIWWIFDWQGSPLRINRIGKSTFSVGVLSSRFAAHTFSRCPF